jgi:hypothetical protein
MKVISSKKSKKNNKLYPFQQGKVTYQSYEQ